MENNAPDNAPVRGAAIMLGVAFQMLEQFIPADSAL
jgi:hypothetical protein